MKEPPVKLLIEQLDGLADEEGYIRFDVRDETRRAVIFVNIEDQSNSPGLLKHSTQPAAFSFDDTYSDREVSLIGMGIRAHLHERHYATNGQTLLL